MIEVLKFDFSAKELAHMINNLIPFGLLLKSVGSSGAVFSLPHTLKVTHVDTHKDASVVRLFSDPSRKPDIVLHQTEGFQVHQVSFVTGGRKFQSTTIFNQGVEFLFMYEMPVPKEVFGGGL